MRALPPAEETGEDDIYTSVAVGLLNKGRPQAKTQSSTRHQAWCGQITADRFQSKRAPEQAWAGP